MYDLFYGPTVPDINYYILFYSILINVCLEFQSSIDIHYNVTGLQSWENYTIRNVCSETGPTMCHENNFN